MAGLTEDDDSYREIMKPETGHLYVYCAGINPVNYVDPSRQHFNSGTSL